jgi:predicted transcriptional regulator
MGDLSDFEEGQVIGVRLAGTSRTKTATSLDVSRVTVSKVMSAYRNHEKITSARRSSEQK